MIKLNYPSIDRGYYVILFGALYGPISLTGRMKSVLYTKRSITDTLVEHDGIWGENDVEHIALEGEVTYVPGLKTLSSQHSPTPPYINSMMVSVYDNGYLRDFILSGGVAVSDRSLIYYKSDTTIGQRAYQQLSETSWIYASLQINRCEPRVVIAYSKYIFTMNPHNGKIINIDVTQISYPGAPWTNDTSTDWSHDQPASLVLNFRPSGRIASESKSTWSMGLYQAMPMQHSPTALLNVLSSYSQRDMLSQNDLPLIDYGELAMTASKKVIANDVNMLAFLHDLRDPKSLIPKLKNLGKLKTYGDNYLTYKYGVLPTISDLQEIYAAVKRRAPFFDKNGFKTYNAAHITSDKTGDYSVMLEQRIKLAIETEDNDLHAIIQSLENIGMFPTLENLWDLVPYSFVLDWFTGIGDYLERVDTRLRLRRLNIRYTTSSYRRTAKLDAAKIGYPLTGWIGKVHYHRWVSDQCPVPSSFSQSKPDASGHWLEAGALLLQRTK